MAVEVEVAVYVIVTAVMVVVIVALLVTVDVAETVEVVVMIGDVVVVVVTVVTGGVDVTVLVMTGIDRYELQNWVAADGDDEKQESVLSLTYPSSRYAVSAHGRGVTVCPGAKKKQVPE